MGGVPPPCSPSHDHDSFFRISYLLFPFFSHICALFCAILYFLSRIKYPRLFFSSDSALFGKNARGGVPPLSPKSEMKRFPAISEASPARSTHPASAGGLGCPLVVDFVGMRILRFLALGLGTDAGVFEGDHAFREGFGFEQGGLALGEATEEERDALPVQHRDDANVKVNHH